MDIKLGLGIPSGGAWQSYTGLCIAQLVGHFERSTYEGGSKELEIISVNAHLPQGRNIVVEEAVRADCTHLLWIDTDMVFPPDAAARLIQHGKGIVGCNYPRRQFPCIPTAYKVGEFENDDDGILYSDDKTGLEEVKHLGMGLMMVDMEIFRACLEPPWFVFEPSGKWGLKTRGEDVYFCEKYARETGLPIWCDHDLSQEVAHVGEFVFTHPFARAMVDTDPAALGIATDKRGSITDARPAELAMTIAGAQMAGADDASAA